MVDNLTIRELNSNNTVKFSSLSKLDVMPDNIIKVTAPRNYIIGYSSFPSEEYKTIERGDNLYAYTFLRTSAMVGSYQNLNLELEYDKGSLEVSLTIENPLDSSGINHNSVVLEPSYPVFMDGYACKIKLYIHPKNNISKGKYYISVNTPSEYGIGRPIYKLALEIR
jgi:hypothetical protein